MTFPADRIQVRIPPVQDKLHKAFFALKDTLPHCLCVGLGEAVEAT